MKKKIILGYILAFLFIIFTGFSYAIEIGRLSKYRGNIFIVRDGKEFKVEEPNIPILNKDVIKSGEGEVEIRYNDGSTLTLDKNTDIMLVEEVGKESFYEVLEKERLLRKIRINIGGLWFNIIPREGMDVSFDTPHAVARVSGTKGYIKVERESSYFELSDGGMKIKDKFVGRVVAIRRNQATKVRKGKSPTEPERISPRGPIHIPIPTREFIPVPPPPAPLGTGGGGGVTSPSQ